MNQRALIDKVLARYSGEHTVFRELLQNADDAGATAAEIIFETQSFLDHKPASDVRLPDLKEEIVCNLTCTEGRIFNGLPPRYINGVSAITALSSGRRIGIA